MRMLPLQVLIGDCEAALGPAQAGQGSSLFVEAAHPLAAGCSARPVIPAGFPYAPEQWSALSATALSWADDAWGAYMAAQHQRQQPAVDIPGEVLPGWVHACWHRCACLQPVGLHPGVIDHSFE